MPYRCADLFCKAGGAGWGYHLAGFEVRGLDKDPQLRYPFEFVQGDALGDEALRLIEWADFIHASPPCQDYSAGKRLAIGRGVVKEHPDLIAKTREFLRSTGKPYIIENVPGSPLEGYVQMCGSYFDLRVTKERWFESNIPIVGTPCVHKGNVKRRNMISDDDGYYWRCYGHERNVAKWKEAQGTPWMNREEAANAIPPAFTEYLGGQVIAYLDEARRHSA